MKKKIELKSKPSKNLFIDKDKHRFDQVNINIRKIFGIYKNLIKQLDQNIELGVIITDNYLRIEYFNSIALYFSYKNKKIKKGDNLSNFFQNDSIIVDEIIKIMDNKKNIDKLIIFRLNNLIFNLFPICYNKKINKLLFFIKLQPINKNDI